MERTLSIIKPDGVRQAGAFHIDDAAGSAYLPAQRDFVRRFGIQSVIGFGDVLPDNRERYRGPGCLWCSLSGIFRGAQTGE